MLGSFVSSLPALRLGLLIPFVLLAGACGDDASADNPAGADGGAASDGASGADGGIADGGTGVDDGAVAPDTTPPTVVSNDPLTAATGEATTTAISATFSEPMDPLSVTATTFSVKQGTADVPGAVLRQYSQLFTDGRPRSQHDLHSYGLHRGERPRWQCARGDALVELHD